MSGTRKRPVVIELDDNQTPKPATQPRVIENDDRPPPKTDETASKPSISPADAPAIVDGTDQAQHTAMGYIASYAGRKPSKLFKWFWSLLVAMAGFVLSLWAYNYVAHLMATTPYLGVAALVIFAAFALVLLLIAFAELRAYSRLSRIDTIQDQSNQAFQDGNRDDALKLSKTLRAFYRGRPELAEARSKLAKSQADVLDADAIINQCETLLMTDLDKRAEQEVQAAVRQVATVTALVPLALADVIAALTSNIRMVRRIAEIYGGRAGSFGSWRLMRTVLTHLVATGAVAVTDDMIGSIAGGGVLGKVSRRFGEGVINGALTARVGVAAIEVCRPLEFRVLKKPGVTGLVQRALTGFFGKGS